MNILDEVVNYAEAAAVWARKSKLTLKNGSDCKCAKKHANLIIDMAIITLAASRIPGFHNETLVACKQTRSLVKLVLGNKKCALGVRLKSSEASPSCRALRLKR